MSDQHDYDELCKAVKTINERDDELVYLRAVLDAAEQYVLAYGKRLIQWQGDRDPPPSILPLMKAIAKAKTTGWHDRRGKAI